MVGYIMYFLISFICGLLIIKGLKNKINKKYKLKVFFSMAFIVILQGLVINLFNYFRGIYIYPFAIHYSLFPLMFSPAIAIVGYFLYRVINYYSAKSQEKFQQHPKRPRISI